MKKMIKKVTAWMLIITLVVPVGIFIGAKEYVNATEDIAWGFFLVMERHVLTGVVNVPAVWLFPKILDIK